MEEKKTVKKTSTTKKSTAAKKKNAIKKDETKVVKEEVKEIKKEEPKKYIVQKEEKIIEPKKETKEEMKVIKNVALDSLSKVIYILSKIIEVASKIGIVVLMLMMIALPFFMNKLEVTKSFYVFNDKVTDYEITNSSIKFIKHGTVTDTISIQNKENVQKVVNYLIEKSDVEVSLVGDFFLACGCAILFASALLAKKLGKLFKNIYTKKTPFIEENVKLSKSVFYLLLICVVAPFLFSYLLGFVLNIWLCEEINLINVILILITLALHYVFDYGYQLEKKMRENN